MNYATKALSTSLGKIEYHLLERNQVAYPLPLQLPICVSFEFRGISLEKLLPPKGQGMIFNYIQKFHPEN